VDAIDILGDLLGHRTQRPGRGTDVLQDIFGRGSRRTRTTQVSKEEIKNQSDDLEDLLNVANERAHQRHQTPGAGKSIPVGKPQSTAGGTSQNDKALVLIRAMTNAAKADGQLDRSEQQKIMDRLGSASAEAIEFLKQEFARPMNVQEFVREVPVGMEQQVYKLSLIVIDLDTGREADYLMQLAEGLRIPSDVREKIHADLGAPSIY
jgi:uncharacterized membrane protein YebE (DUF533 family)